MSNFIVRIYRREKDEFKQLVGTIEHVETGHKRVFKQIQEIWNFLTDDKKTGKSETVQQPGFEKTKESRRAWFPVRRARFKRLGREPAKRNY